MQTKIDISKLDPQRILIIKPSSLGDVVHTLPVLKLLSKRFPSAKISWLVSSAFENLLQGHPLLHEVIPFERDQFRSAWWNPRALGALRTFVCGLQNRGFDLVIDLQGLLRSGWLTAQTHAPIRVGFSAAREFGWIFYNHRVDVGSIEQHAVTRYLKLAAALGCASAPADAPVEFPFVHDDVDRKYVDSLVCNEGEYAVLLPATNWPTKRWPVERFAALVEPLQKRFNLKTVVAGGRDTVPLVAKIPGALDLAGKTSLRQLVLLLERASLIIANDTGPMHIASALNRPLVALFGPTNPNRTGPYGREDSVLRLDLPCSPCYARKCSHQSCLRWLEIAPVLEAAERQLATCLTHATRDTHYQR